MFLPSLRLLFGCQGIYLKRTRLRTSFLKILNNNVHAFEVFLFENIFIKSCFGGKINLYIKMI